MKANKENLYKHVDFLTSIRPYRNYLHLESLDVARKYIYKQLESYSLELNEQSWIADKNKYYNVIGSFNPKKAKRLIIGAHYDVCGDQPGADDNASAVAGLLETARMISELNPSLDYGIDFVSYCLEEPPFFATQQMGSYVHAKSLHDNSVDVIGMICYEMIGYFSEEPQSQNFPTPELSSLFPDKGNFIVVVGLKDSMEFNEKFYKNMSLDSKIDVQKMWFDDKNGLAGLSDHRCYWEFGYPAIMINDTSFLRNPNYHEVSDTIETLDFDKMTKVVNSSFKGIINL